MIGFNIAGTFLIPFFYYFRAMGGEMMRDARGGITGRLNSGTADPMWGGPPQQPPHHVPHHQAQPPNKMGPAPNPPGKSYHWSSNFIPKKS